MSGRRYSRRFFVNSGSDKAYLANPSTGVLVRVGKF